MPDINMDATAVCPSTGSLFSQNIPSASEDDKLLTTNWGEEWKRLQALRHEPDNPAFWNERARSFPADMVVSPYAKRFLELAKIQEGETVFDMGCGTGALSLPLGKAGHKVVAADFSQAMLDRMQEVMDANGVRTVFPKLMSWEEDWAAKGVREGMVDVCLASRSIATADLHDSLLRLNKIARRRVCITLATASSPRIDENILTQLGLRGSVCRDFLYAINILVQEGIFPTVDYIKSARYDTYDHADEAAASLRRMINSTLGKQGCDTEKQKAYQRLETWLSQNLVENPQVGQPDNHGNPQKALRLATPRVITWAFIAWDKQ